MRLTLLLAYLFLQSVHGDWDASRFAWYSKPGDGFASGLPIGNGRLGALVYGGAVEKVTLNENSVWSGPFMDRVNKNSLGALSGIRTKFQNGDISGANSQIGGSMYGSPQSPRAYNPTVDMSLDFGHDSSKWSNYSRTLDTLMGTATVSYTLGGVTYTRQYVPSKPAGVVGIRLSASQAGSLNVKIGLSRSKQVTGQSANAGSASVTLKGNSGGGGDAITFTSELRVVAKDRTVAASGNSIQVSKASTIDIFFDAETSYRYSSSSAWEAELKKKLDSAVAMGFPSFKSDATADYSSLMGRVSLDLGSSGSTGSQTTDARLSAFKRSPNADPQLATLMFNFGRHSLVASSRDTGAKSLPANLQGIWNDNFSPPWQSKYTININTEMNYWPALSTNLAETHKPLFDLIEVVRQRGAAVAKTMYGCPGFVAHHNTDLWGDSVPVDGGTSYSVWPMGGAWLTFHLMEQYRYTQDKQFLQEKVWPVLQANADFYYCYMFNFNGNMVTGPSLSPENTFKVPSGMSTSGRTEGADIAPAMDGEILFALFTNIIDACKILGITDSNLTKAQDYLSKLRLPQIGSNGRILEWRGDYPEAEPGHRHMSPLWGLYPGSQMTPLVNQKLATASKALVDHRMQSGSGSTGWSRTWVMNIYARLLDGDNVWSNAQAFIQKFPSTNLWNTDNGPGTSMQIDGNFGYTAAIAEMLLQSHGPVHILPALPKAVAKGSVTGLAARGNFVVDISWEGGALKQAVVMSNSGVNLDLRVQNSVSILVDGKAYSGPISTTAGTKYVITRG
ncbi:Six-hairpin glycosidase-like protein [Clohesyomyces aquaticus]|uniref:Six-hairpin glycosidase-like protein n=1 Tax=Clohesyomyces aquaticus TaxID=1231657 RepID=A0A1Y1ZWD7_9PLEO|nr:Six-hairpin glycosidase-like protein [Clohesyomyces aquaticus]